MIITYYNYMEKEFLKKQYKTRTKKKRKKQKQNITRYQVTYISFFSFINFYSCRNIKFNWHIRKKWNSNKKFKLVNDPLNIKFKTCLSIFNTSIFLGDICGPLERWILPNESTALKSPGASKYPCSISCLWIIHTTEEFHGIYVGISFISIPSKSDLLVIGNGDNPQDKSSVFAEPKGSLSAGSGFVTPNNTIWISLVAAPCEISRQGEFEFVFFQINGSGNTRQLV